MNSQNPYIPRTDSELLCLRDMTTYCNLHGYSRCAPEQTKQIITKGT